LLPKFIEECNRLLPDGAADSTTCVGLYAHCIRVSQQCPYENRPQMLEKEQWPPNNSPNLNGIEISCLGSDAWSYFKTFIRSPEQFLN